MPAALVCRSVPCRRVGRFSDRVVSPVTRYSSAVTRLACASFSAPGGSRSSAWSTSALGVLGDRVDLGLQLRAACRRAGWPSPGAAPRPRPPTWWTICETPLTYEVYESSSWLRWQSLTTSAITITSTTAKAIPRISRPRGPWSTAMPPEAAAGAAARPPPERDREDERERPDPPERDPPERARSARARRGRRGLRVVELAAADRQRRARARAGHLAGRVGVDRPGVAGCAAPRAARRAPVVRRRVAEDRVEVRPLVVELGHGYVGWVRLMEAVRTVWRRWGGSGRGGTRTPKLMRALDPEPSVSTNSTTRPGVPAFQGCGIVPRGRSDPGGQGWSAGSWKIPPMSSHATSDRRALGRYVLGPAIGRGATAVVHRARTSSPARRSP